MQLISVVFAATLSGLLLAPYLACPQQAGWGMACIMLCGAFCSRRRPFFSAVFLFGCFFLLAQLRYPLQFPQHPVLENLAKQTRKYQLSGVVTSFRARSEGAGQLDVSVDEVLDRGQPVPLTGPFMLRLYLGQGLPDVLPGDRVRVKSRIRRPRLFGTPGEFHWPRHLASLGISATGWIKSVEDLVIEPTDNLSPQRKIAGLQRHWSMQLQDLLPEQQANLVRALLLGESAVLPKNIRRQLAAAGISHLFAISGLHLGLLGVFGYRLLLYFYRRQQRLVNWQPPQRVIPLVLLPLLLAYLLLTGDAVATRRAFVLAATGAVLLVWRRRVNSLQLLVSLALLFLLANPLLLWQPAWQLSFSGVAGILLWQPAWQGLPSKLPSWLVRPLALLLVSLAATLATLPLVIFNFHLFSVVGVLANLFCVPLVACLALPLGLLGLGLLELSTSVGPVLLQACGWLLEQTVYWADWLTALPGLHARTLFLSSGQMTAVFFGLLPLLLLWQLKQRRRFLQAVLLCGCLALLCGYNYSPARQSPELIMFSVGQGDAMLLKGADGRAVLIDGGGLYSDRFDVGERLLAPALGYLGVAKLDAVVLTHDHPDHRKGLIFLLEHFPTAAFWTSHRFDELAADLRKILRQRKIPVRVFPTGWSEVELLNHGKLSMFVGLGQNANKNDRSLVLYLQQQNQGLLLTGDLEEKGVKALLKYGLPGPVTLLKLPHHGSRYSRSEDLLDQLQPKLCMVSSGYQNRYRLPARQVVAELSERKIPLWRTDQQGTLRFVLDESAESGWRVEKWQQGLFR